MKRQPIEWEKIFANNTTDKGLIHKIQTAHTTQYQKNTNNLIKKMCRKEGNPIIYNNMNKPMNLKDTGKQNKPDMKI